MHLRAKLSPPSELSGFNKSSLFAAGLNAGRDRRRCGRFWRLLGNSSLIYKPTTLSTKLRRASTRPAGHHDSTSQPCRSCGGRYRSGRRSPLRTVGHRLRWAAAVRLADFRIFTGRACTGASRRHRRRPWLGCLRSHGLWCR